MSNIIIGRSHEKEILNELLISGKSELVAVYGRRRVGKTYLIRSHLEKHIVFSCSGQIDGSVESQLENFHQQLKKYFPYKKKLQTPENWKQAFQLLEECINTISHKRRKVLFIDEMPWLDTRKSEFLSSFSYFWNMYVETKPDLMVIICGSAASWMIKKVVKNKGGLHNRITQRIRLLPFTLAETNQYLLHHKIALSPYQLCQLYMVTGGVPHYLNGVKKGRSIAQNIQQLCFTKDGLLHGEFNNLYRALFAFPEKHIAVVEALAKKQKGLTRHELLKIAKLSSGGSLTVTLDELTESGFIQRSNPFGKSSRDSLYRLIDEFSLFYFRFMHLAPAQQKNYWMSVSQSNAYASWCGYAFENLCMRHIDAIKESLGITGIATTEASWYLPGKANTDGAQIDLLINRADNCINLCEIKFSEQPFSITKAIAAKAGQKRDLFIQYTGYKKQVLLTWITTKGLVDNNWQQQVADVEVVAEKFIFSTGK
jgi:AAA+ ATPase superfamily predicted ATPase